jgi:CRISPR-associated protein Cas1
LTHKDTKSTKGNEKAKNLSFTIHTSSFTILQGGDHMTAIYVREQGAKVRRRQDRLVVSKSGQVLDEFPLNQVNQVVLMGNVQLTTQAAATLLQRDVDVVFLSVYGKFRGRLAGNGSKHVHLRHRQLRLMDDETAALQVAKAIVDAKIHNQRVILLRQSQRLQSGGGQERGALATTPDYRLFRQAVANMMQMRQAAEGAATLNQLRGFEGKAAAYHFEAIRSLLDPAWGFDRRDYYPPPDPFNALLSFCYSLLLKDVQAAVQMTGLDLYLGFFHEVQYGRPSLALDLMEEWRPLVGDSLALELVNRGMLLPDQFRRTGRPNRPVELGEQGVNLVLEAYGSRLSSRMHHPLAGGAEGGQATLQRVIVLQTRRMARFLAGKETDYQPIRAK